MAIYLGLDSSTQSLSLLAIEVAPGRREVIFDRSLNFDETFPAHGTRHGVLPHADPLVAHSSPQLWAEALDRLLGIFARESGVDLAQIRAIAGSGQQHGSVYLNASATGVLAALDPARPLVEQLAGIYSRATSPIWMDSSTHAECLEIAAAVGGDEALAVLTGSRAFERFTGPQIRKFARSEPEAYSRTDKIHLVSSFMASLLAGKHAPIDPGDGAGMNLMDLAGKRWAPRALEATAPGLAGRLPPIEASSTIVGDLSPFWVRRHGLPAKARVVAWSGDNPCSLIGVGLVSPGRIAVSLGTSTTLFGFLPGPTVDPTGSGHVFGSPTGEYMSLICFENGALARDAIRKEHGLDWAGFSAALRRTPPGNRGAVLLPWLRPEITPKVHSPGFRRYHLEAHNPDANVRAVVEAQMLALAIHSQWMGVDIRTVHATGGSAVNRDILQVMADVLGAEVHQLQVSNSASLGAALRAYHADLVAAGERPRWEDVIAGFAEPVRGSAVLPRTDAVRSYTELRPLYAACEAHALGNGPDPTDRLAAYGRARP